MTDPASATDGDSYSVLVEYGYATIGGLAWYPSKTPVIRYRNFGSWYTLPAESVQTSGFVAAPGGKYLVVGSSVTVSDPTTINTGDCYSVTVVYGSAVIGGVTIRNALPVIAAGADMVAVISDLFNAMDIRRRAGEFQKLFDRK